MMERFGSVSLIAFFKRGSRMPGLKRETMRTPPAKWERSSSLFIKSLVKVTCSFKGAKNIGRIGPCGSVYLASRTTPTILYMPSKAGRSMPKSPVERILVREEAVNK